MPRKLRRAAAAVSFLLLTLLFLDFTGTLHRWFGWLAKIQLLPALLALNLGVVAALAVVTLLFGRIYCSVVCPLGVFQDLVSWGAGRRRRNRFRYSPARNRLRYGVLAAFAVALFAGVGPAVALLDPYGAWGRIASTLLGPLWLWGNNLLALLAERVDSYAVYDVEVWLRSASTLGVAVATLAAVSLLAWKGGRSWCNSICPVGTMLGALSRFAVFKPRFDLGQCTGCGACARSCKASCIDQRSKQIDYSRCVMCFACQEACSGGAIRLAPGARPQSPVQEEGGLDVAGASRRSFVTAAALAAASVAGRAQAAKADGGLAVIKEKKAPERSEPIKPPGARSVQEFARRCTGCQLCVSVCGNQVLRPSGGLGSLMQPELSFERGYCRPECTRCSEVCPTGAIRAVGVDEKSAIQIGHAVWVPERCLVSTDQVSCDNCARHCPPGAIRMEPKDPKGPGSPKFPVVDAERCIGCGACEFLCPARPLSAMVVQGHQRHRTV